MRRELSKATVEFAPRLVLFVVLLILQDGRLF